MMDLFAPRPKITGMKIETYMIVAANADVFQQKLQTKVNQLTLREHDPKEPRIDQGIDIDYKPVGLSTGMQYTALVVYEYKTTEPYEDDEDVPEGDSPIFHPLTMMRGKQVD